MQKSGKLVVLIVVLLLGVVAYLAKDKIIQKLSHEAVEEERQAWQEKTQKLEKEITTLQEEVKKAEPAVPQEKVKEALGEVPGAAPSSDEEQCKEVKTKAAKFFSYLDQKGYLKAYAIEDPAQEHFKKVIELLEKSRPIISGETQDLYTLMKNITYFYRLLGDKNLKLGKDILSRESDIIEPTMEVLFASINPWQKCAAAGVARLSPEALYEYAGFFLNTIAGQAYLARRESKIKTLTAYYSLIILDKANAEGLNKYGIDIRSHITSVTGDIESYRGFSYKKKYLRTLRDMKQRYQRAPQGASIKPSSTAR